LSADRGAGGGLAALAATGFGLGRFPFAPGTVGSAGAAVVLLAVGLAGDGGWPFGLAAQIVLVAVLTILSIPVCTRAEKVFGHDGSPIVLDEVVGQAAALVLLPLTPGIVLASFLLFRVFDIVKPFPANRAQHLPGGTGVVLDDLVAGLYANLVIQAALWAAPKILGG
jgi:phosphatidylglycerophosphatase A